MTELPLIFIGGLLGSSHCLGMCGPLALTVGMAETGVTANLTRQLMFSMGRISTYGFLGAAAGFCGWWLSLRPVTFVNTQSMLAIGAGLFLVLLGLTSTGFLPRLIFRHANGSHVPQICSSASWLKTFLTTPGLTAAMLAGVFTGFLPCGLVYAFLAFAASTSDIFHGWLTMVTFGLGTVPLMILAGFGGSLFCYTMRTRILHVAAWCVVLSGVITLARGFGFMQLSVHATSGTCPFCR